MKIRLALLSAALASGVAGVAFAAETMPKADPSKAQKTATEVCAACHGPAGQSPIPANPHLAGQIAEYTTKQLMNFKAADGKQAERVNPIMAGMVANLSPEDMRNLAAYYASQPPNAGFARDAATVELGQQIYRGGIVSQGIPACSGCHGATGAGMPAEFPRLAGQHPDYIEAQMKSWRSGARANDPGKMMREIASKMSDTQIKAVADYIAGLR
jgi:cytochrome c553